MSSWSRSVQATLRRVNLWIREDADAWRRYRQCFDPSFGGWLTSVDAYLRVPSFDVREFCRGARQVSSTAFAAAVEANRAVILRSCGSELRSSVDHMRELDARRGWRRRVGESTASDAVIVGFVDASLFSGDSFVDSARQDDSDAFCVAVRVSGAFSFSVAGMSQQQAHAAPGSLVDPFRWAVSSDHANADSPAVRCSATQLLLIFGPLPADDKRLGDLPDVRLLSLLPWLPGMLPLPPDDQSAFVASVT